MIDELFGQLEGSMALAAAPVLSRRTSSYSTAGPEVEPAGGVVLDGSNRLV